MTRDDLAAAMLHADRSGATDAEVTMRYATAIAQYVDARLGAASTPAPHIPVAKPPLGPIRRPVMDRLDPSGAMRELVEKAAALAQAATLFQNDPGSMSRDAELRQAVEAVTPILAELGALEPSSADVPDVAQTDGAPADVVTEQTLAQYLWAAPEHLKGAIADFVTLTDKVSTYGIELAVATRTSSTDPAWLEKAPLFERLNAFICAYQYYPHQTSVALATTDPEQQLAPRHSHICPQCDGTGRRYTAEAHA